QTTKNPMMEAKDFELPIEGSLSKLTFLPTQQQEEQPIAVPKGIISKNKLLKSFPKSRKSISKKKK
ncbi:MAG TPA: hypothetical protein PKV76_10960, partial [Chitinophagales bacterium]|nr:hypothetical protein [Chitinophagales bacterium]